MSSDLRSSSLQQQQITKQDAAQNVLIAITLQIRARQEEFVSGRSPLVLSERVVHLIEKTRRRYISSSSQNQIQNNGDEEGNPTTTSVAVKKYIPNNVSKALFEELQKISFLLVLGRVKGSSFEDQAREEEEAARRAQAQRRRAQDQMYGGGISSLLGGNNSNNPNSMMMYSNDAPPGQHGASGGQHQGKSLCFAAFPNLVNVAFYGCHIRKLDSLSCAARFTCLDSEVPPTASMPLLSVFGALRHVEFDLELGSISPIVEQLSSFCFSLRSVVITIVESPGVNDKNLSAAATAVTMNRRLFADVWRPKGAQVKLLGATQKKQDQSKDGNNNHHHKDDSFRGYWEALSLVQIKGDLSRRRGDGRTLGVLMLDDSWRGLKQVTRLSLRGLRFTSFLEVSALQSLVNLRDLDLGDNAFISLAGASESFPKQNLRTLRLDSNKVAGGLADLSAFEKLENLDLSVNQLSEWTELTPLSANKNLQSLDLRANSLDARAPFERNSVVNAEDVVCIVLRVIGCPQSVNMINGYPISTSLRLASETGKIKKSTDAILAHEQQNHDNLDKANLRRLENENPAVVGNQNMVDDDDEDADMESQMRKSQVTHSQAAGGGGGKKKKRVVVKGVPTRVVELGRGNTQKQTAMVVRKRMASSNNNKGDSGEDPFQMNQIGLEYLRKTFGDQYLLHLPQHEFPAFIDPDDPTAGQQRSLSYEQVKADIGVDALLKEGATPTKDENENSNNKVSKSSSSNTMKRTPIHQPVQPVFDQFLSEIRRHEWYSLPTSDHASRQKIFSVGCEMMMSQITFENASFWESNLLPLAKQSQNQPYAVHPEGREICLVNATDKSNKANETHLRYFRKVLFRVVETHVGFNRHIRLEERNLSTLPTSFFQQTPKRLAERASTPGSGNSVIRERPPRLNELLNAQTATGVTQDQLDNIPSFSDRYPIFQCVLPSDEHSPPAQLSAKFYGIAKARGGGIKLGTAARDANGNAATDDFDDTQSVSQFSVAPTVARQSTLDDPATGMIPGSSPSQKSGGGGLLSRGHRTEMGIDEMTELSRHRVFGTGEQLLLAGFVVPAKMAQEFKRRLVLQLKTAAAKLSIQGVFREWPFVIRGEGSGERKDASVPIKPTGKYLIDRINDVRNAEPESLSRQRTGNDVGASDQELSLILRRFVLEKKKKFSTEGIPEFDFLAYFNALRPDLINWTPSEERSLIVGLCGTGSSLYCAENIDTIDHTTGNTTATAPEAHFKNPRRYDLQRLRAIFCSFDLSTMRLIFYPESGAAAEAPSKGPNNKSPDLVLISREPRISLQFLATLVRLDILPDASSIVGSDDLELPKVFADIQEALVSGSSSTHRRDSKARGTLAQIFFRPTNIDRFTNAPFIYTAHVFFKTQEAKESKKLQVVNKSVYPIRCIHAVHGGWACARLVVTANHIRLVEVREMTNANPEMMLGRSKKAALEEPFSVDVKQPNQLLRFELSPHSLFPLLFCLVFDTPEAPSRQSEWLLCAPHPATLFSIRREVRNVQPKVQVAEFDPELVDDFTGFPAPPDARAASSVPSRTTIATGGGAGSPHHQHQLPRASTVSSSPPGSPTSAAGRAKPSTLTSTSDNHSSSTGPTTRGQGTSGGSPTYTGNLSFSEYASQLE